MDDMNAFERQLADAMEQRAGLLRPVDDRAIFGAVVAGAQPSRWSFQSMFSATKLVVAGAIVVLFGGFLVAGVLTQPSEPRLPAIGSSASMSPVVLPSVIPEGVESGTLETPLGAARWVRLSGDAADVPNPWNVQRVPGSGWVALGQDGGRGVVWRSSDLITWEHEPAPGDSMWNQLSSTGDRLWLRATEPASLWSSGDGSEWTEVDLDPLTSPQPDGPWILEVDEPLTFDGITAVPFRHSPDRLLIHHAMGGTRDDRPRPYCCRRGTDAKTYRLTSEKGEHVITVMFEDAGDGLTVLDAEDGTELGFLDGVEQAFIELMIDPESPDVHGFALLDEAGLTQVAPPAPITELAETAFGIDDSGFVAFSHGRDGLVRIHRSQDGRSWSETELVGDEPDEPTDIEGVWTHAGTARIGHHDNSFSEQQADGEWKTWPEAPPDGFRFANGALRVDPGEIQAGDSTTDAMWYQEDGAEPISIDPADSLGLVEEILRDMSGRGTGHTGLSPIGPNAGALTFGDEVERHLWIIVFDHVVE